MFRHAHAIAVAVGAVLAAATSSIAAASNTNAAATVAAPFGAGPSITVNPRFDVVLRPQTASAGEVAAFTDPAAAAFGLQDLQLVRIDDVPAAAGPMAVQLVVDGVPTFVELGRSNVRAPGYQVLEDIGGGELVERPAGPVNTMRGVVPGVAGASAAAGLEDDGLHLLILLADGRRVWLEPIARRVDGAPAGLYALYEDADVAPHDFTCGVQHPDIVPPVVGDVAGDPSDLVLGGELCIAQLACDADFEYFQDYGSVSAVESRINLVINVVNNQYEGQVGITHQITAIVVRSSSNDPYTQNDAEDRLCQFITEWTNNQGSIVRDVAHLFTGRNLNGGTIGIASDIGGTGICVNNGGCSGGTFGTFGSYCLSQSDFNGSFSSATDLTAHELGHLWGAFHCSCPSFTMNAFITSANQFSGGSISSITNYRNTRACLDCDGATPDNDDCAQAELVGSNASFTVDTTTATPAPGGSDPQLPNGSPTCQWDGSPEDTHSTVWYRFVATDTSVSIATCDTTDVDDTIIALYDGGCGNLVELACAEDDCGASTYASRICFNGLEVGRIYRVMIGNPGSWAGSQPGLIDVVIQTPCPEVGPQAGACCLPGGACAQVSQAECQALGGTFQGIGTPCAGAGCSIVSGACCLPSGSCVAVTDGECESLGGTFLGGDSDCSDCEQFLGACCLPSGTCSQLTASTCATVGGTYFGDGSDCADIPCGPDCPGDFDASGQVGFEDLVTLLAVFGPCAGCPEDLDGDSNVAFSDLVELLSLFGPCP